MPPKKKSKPSFADTKIAADQDEQTESRRDVGNPVDESGETMTAENPDLETRPTRRGEDRDR
jgi:hypothetical protein